LKTILLVIDHGLAQVYFLHTELAMKLLEKDLRQVFLVQDDLLPKLLKGYE
jgi:hypothetical protein